MNVNAANVIKNFQLITSLKTIAARVHMMMKIKTFIRAIFLSYLIFTLSMGPVLPALASDAALLPNAVQQFFDNNGNPLTSGTVTFYEAGTSTKKDTWNDSAKTTVNANPLTLNAAGRAKTGG